MNPKIDKVVRDVKTTIAEHSPEILTGIGIAGMVTTTVLAVKATPKALMLIEEEKRRQNHENLDEAKRNGQETCAQIAKLQPIETVKTVWKCYIPAALTGVFSISCLVGASSVNARRNAALVTAYKLSETALTEYREKTIETLGEKKEQQIREQIDKDHIDKDPVSNKEIIITGKGDTLCYDTISGRYFKSDVDKIDRIVNKLNKRMFGDMYISLNDFYDELGLDHIPVGYELGWVVDKGLMELSYSTQIADDDRTPCIVINYDIAPKYGFNMFN